MADAAGVRAPAAYLLITPSLRTVAFTINPLFHHQVEYAIAHVETDLLVLTALFGSGLNKAIELACNQVIFPVTQGGVDLR